MATSPVGKVAVGRSHGTSNAGVRAKVETEGNHSKTSTRAQDLGARVVPVSHSRIRVEDHLGTAISVENQTIEQLTARNDEKCKP